jgi:hypothetical protein
MINGFDQSQRERNGEPLKRGIEYYENLCTVDIEGIKAALKEEIEASEKQIEDWKVNKKQRLMERLAGMFASMEGGKILELANAQTGIAQGVAACNCAAI